MDGEELVMSNVIGCGSGGCGVWCRVDGDGVLWLDGCNGLATSVDVDGDDIDEDDPDDNADDEAKGMTVILSL